MQDALDELPPLFELEDITRVTYTRGMAASMADVRRGTGVEVTSWAAPDIPKAVLDSFDIEALDEFPVSLGHPGLAEPMWVESIDVETHEAITRFRSSTAPC